MKRPMLFMAAIFVSGNLFTSQNHYDQAKKGYKILGEKVVERREYLGLYPEKSGAKDIWKDRYSEPIAETWYTVQLPTYKETDGTLVEDKTVWSLSVPCDDKNIYDAVVGILAGNFNHNTRFPIQIKNKERYVSPMMQEKVLLCPISFRWISLQTKLDKDAQAAYALLSMQNKIRHTIFGGNLADPYEHNEESK